MKGCCSYMKRVDHLTYRDPYHLGPSPSSPSSFPPGCMLTRGTSDPTDSGSTKSENSFQPEKMKTHRTTTEVAWKHLESGSITGDCVRIRQKQLEPVPAAPGNHSCCFNHAAFASIGLRTIYINIGVRNLPILH